MSKFYVYIYYHPWDLRPIYVGKGRGNRWDDHLNGVRGHSKRLREELAEHFSSEIYRTKFMENLTNEEACLVEKILIKAFGREDKFTGSLYNRTDGGEGILGRVQTQEEKDRRAKKLIGRLVSAETRAKIGDSHRGRQYPPEVRARMGAPKGTVRSKEASLKAATKLSGLKRPKEVGEKISRASLGRPKSEAHRLALSEAWNLRRAKFTGRYFNIPKKERT